MKQKNSQLEKYVDMDKYPTIAQIDQAAIIHNCHVFRQIIPHNCKICAAAKCNAYGHGIDICIPAFEKAGVDMLCVAFIKESLQIRKLGYKKPILLLGSEFSIYQQKEKMEVAHLVIENGLRITAVNRDDILTLAKAAAKLNKPAFIHVMIDTGMSRMGGTAESVWAIIEEFSENKNVVIEGLYTHFATSDEQDKTFSENQLNKFNHFLEQLEYRNISIPLIHSANSGAAIDMPLSCFNMIRPGISIYGYHSSPQMHHKPDLWPAMKVITHLMVVKHIPKDSLIGYGCTYKAPRNMLIGLVPIGFGDGYDRRLSNSGQMTVGEHLVPVIGRITMDQTILDLSEFMDKDIAVKAGDQVIVIDNKRESPHSVESLALQLGTIPNEIVTNVGPRIIRCPYKQQQGNL